MVLFLHHPAILLGFISHLHPQPFQALRLSSADSYSSSSWSSFIILRRPREIPVWIIDEIIFTFNDGSSFESSFGEISSQ
jgi:hypothetical protein